MGTFANKMSCFHYLPGLPGHLSGQQEQCHLKTSGIQAPSVSKTLSFPLTHSHSNSFDHHPQTNLSDPPNPTLTTKNQLFRGKRHLIPFLL